MASVTSSPRATSTTPTPSLINVILCWFKHTHLYRTVWYPCNVWWHVSALQSEMTAVHQWDNTYLGPSQRGRTAAPAAGGYHQIILDYKCNSRSFGNPKRSKFKVICILACVSIVLFTKVLRGDSWSTMFRCEHSSQTWV